VRDERDLKARVRARDGGFRRQRALTALLAVGMTALAGAVSALAAGTFAGRKLVHAVAHPRTHVAVRRSRAAIPPPPPLPAVGSTASPGLSAPAQSPAPTPAPPVAVSGGS